MCSEEHFFSWFYYPDEIVTENEGYVEFFSFLHALLIWSHIINNLILFARALLQNFRLRAEFLFMDLAQRLGQWSENFIPQSGILQ